MFGRRSARGENLEVSEDAQADMFVLTHEMLGDAGYQGYEVSNFAANVHHQSVHNRKYLGARALPRARPGRPLL